MTPTLFLEFQGSENSVKEQAAVAGEQPMLLLMLYLVGHFEALRGTGLGLSSIVERAKYAFARENRFGFLALAHQCFTH